MRKQHYINGTIVQQVCRSCRNEKIEICFQNRFVQNEHTRQKDTITERERESDINYIYLFNESAKNILIFIELLLVLH